MDGAVDGDILIIGAGPAGLACAMELARAGRTATLLERDEAVGGLAKTLEIREGDLLFRTDIGPHRFFSKNAYLYEFIEDLLHEEWRPVPRRTRQFIDGKFYDYPIDAFQVLRNIGPVKAARIAADFLAARVRYGLLGKRVETFEDHVVASFGRSLAEFSMINYTEKIWGIPAATIHPDWARQRISGLNLLSVLKNALFVGRGSGTPKSLVDEFYYPQFGTGRIYERIGERLRGTGSSVHVRSWPVRVRHDGRRVREVECLVDGEPRTLRPEHVVESVPITRFLDLLDPPPPPEVLEAARALRWRSQVYLFVTLDKPRVTQDNWIYFPSKDIPFGRVSEMKNFSPEMAPADKTSLFVEFFAFETEPVWRMTEQQVLELALPWFEEYGFFRRSEVRKAYLGRRRYVYPVYDMEYPGNLEVVKRWLDRLENLHYVGRPGRFKYTNQDHSLEMGIVAGRSLLEGKRYDQDLIGAENEYFEAGRIYEKRLP